MKDQLKGDIKVTNTKNSTAEAIGEVRWFPLESVLRPRLLMRTESIGDIIYDCLLSTHKHWLEFDYGNKPDPGFLLFQLQRNLKDEVEGAWKKFVTERKKV
jgi:hypothetical protein